MILGLSFLAYPLAFLHLLHAILFDNPWATENSNEFSVKYRALMFDGVVIAVLMLAAGAKLYSDKKTKNE